MTAIFDYLAQLLQTNYKWPHTVGEQLNHVIRKWIYN